MRPRLADVAPELRALERRLFLKRGLSLGSLALLTGCDVSNNQGVADALAAMSRWNNEAQSVLFSRTRLARTFPASAITKPFPFNAYYGPDDIREVDAAAWRLELGGQIADKRPWSLAQLRALPQESQITRHICVEGWSAIGQWSGVKLSTFLQHVGADLRCRYVGVKCFDDYSTSLDMPSALHPQTILALDYGSDPLPPLYGAPLKIRIPTKLGFKNPKYIASLFVTDTYPGGYWEDQGYNWFSGS